MNLNQFHKKFDGLSKEQRFAMIEFSPEPTSFFVIFQKLYQARAQKKFFEEQEEHLLKQAEEAFNKLNNG